MPSFDRQLAEAVAAAITANAADLPEAVTVSRVYRPKYDLGQLQTPRVDVAHGLQQRAPASRTHTRRTHTIRVAITAAIAQTAGQIDRDRCDQLSDLTEAVADLIETHADQFEAATLTAMETAPYFDPEALDNPGTWQGVLTLTFERRARA